MNLTLTNIVAAISVALTTNVFFEYPKETRYVPCPDKMPGCLVYHVDQFPVENPTTRHEITEVREITTIHLLSYERTLELTNRVVSRTAVQQKLATTWVKDDGVTNRISSILYGWSRHDGAFAVTNYTKPTNLWIQGVGLEYSITVTNDVTWKSNTITWGTSGTNVTK